MQTHAHTQRPLAGSRLYARLEHGERHALAPSTQPMPFSTRLGGTTRQPMPPMPQVTPIKSTKQPFGRIPQPQPFQPLTSPLESPTLTFLESLHLSVPPTLTPPDQKKARSASRHHGLSPTLLPYLRRIPLFTTATTAMTTIIPNHTTTTPIASNLIASPPTTPST